MTLRYFDPGYQIRSRPANCEDAALCDQFARQAVHAAMAGKTGLVIGFLHGLFIHVPTGLIVSRKKQLEPDSILWQAVLLATGSQLNSSEAFGTGRCIAERNRRRLRFL